MPQALTYEDLDKLECACGRQDCRGIIFHSACHKTAPTTTRYVRDEKKLYIECAICRSLVVAVIVGPPAGTRVH